MCPCQASFTIFRVLNTYALAQNTLNTATVGDSIPSVNPPRHGDSIPSVNPTPSTTTTKRACERTETNVWETPLRSSMLSFENLLLPPRSWWLDRGLTRAHHRSIDAMQAHLRSCIVPEKNNSWLWWMLAVRAAGSSCSISVSSKSVTLRWVFCF